MIHKTRLGVDIGGTFTDVVLEHRGALYSSKVLTTYDTPGMQYLMASKKFA